MAGEVMLWDGKVLYRESYGGKIAIDPACCCEELPGELCACSVGRAPSEMLVYINGPPIGKDCCIGWQQWHSLPWRTGSGGTTCEWWGRNANYDNEAIPIVDTIPCDDAIKLSLNCSGDLAWWTLFNFVDSTVWNLFGLTAPLIIAGESVLLLSDDGLGANCEDYGSAKIKPG